MARVKNTSVRDFICDANFIGFKGAMSRWSQPRSRENIERIRVVLVKNGRIQALFAVKK
jgi:hypothetical protein